MFPCMSSNRFCHYNYFSHHVVSPQRDRNKDTQRQMWTQLQSAPVPWAQPQYPTWFRFPISLLPKDYMKCVFTPKIWLAPLPETQTSKPNQTILIMSHFFIEGNEGCKQPHIWSCGRSQTPILRAGSTNIAHNHAGIYFIVCF